MSKLAHGEVEVDGLEDEDEDETRVRDAMRFPSQGSAKD